MVGSWHGRTVDLCLEMTTCDVKELVSCSGADVSDPPHLYGFDFVALHEDMAGVSKIPSDEGATWPVGTLCADNV